MSGEVANKKFSYGILEYLEHLEEDISLLDNENFTQCIIRLLQTGADPNIQNQDGKTLSYYLDKHLLNILNDLENDSNLLNDSNNIKYIGSLLKIGANPNVQNQAGRTLSYYLDKHLLNILNDLEDDSNLLDNPNNIEYIGSLLGAGADPNVQNQAGKTLLHYVAEHNNIDAIRFLLSKKADPSITDKSGKTPAKYATESDCIRAVNCPDPDKDQGYHSDGSCENKENPANNSSNYPNKHNDDQALRDDLGYGSGDDNKAISTEPSDCDRKDEDSSCSSSDYLFLEDSLLAKLGIPLTTDEQELIDKFCEEIRGITTKNKQESEESILESIEKIVNEYLEKGLRLNSSCSNGNEKGDKETVTNLILEEIEDVLNHRVNPRFSTGILNIPDCIDESDGNECEADKYKTSGIIIKKIISNLLLKGGGMRKIFSTVIPSLQINIMTVIIQMISVRNIRVGKKS